MQPAVPATAPGTSSPVAGSRGIHRAQSLVLTVAVLTYRRVDQLRDNLSVVCSHVAALCEQEMAVSASVLVVDNDPAASARSIVEERFPSACYVVEPRAGISAARNRAIHEAGSSDLLVFIDDDERPRSTWLLPLIETWQASGATAVPGRVVPHFESPPERWILDGHFFDRPERASGTRMRSVAAGNLLLDLRQLRASGITFEEPFGATGGEDSLLGQRLAKAGHEIVWCAESVVEDLVPTERLTKRWVLQRAYSQGNLQALIDCHLADGWLTGLAARARRAAAAMWYITRGSAGTTRGYVIADQSRQAIGLRTAYRGLGMLSGLMGRAYTQYARTDALDSSGDS